MAKHTENQLGKVPPQSSDVENFVLGTILIDSNAMDKVAKEFTSNLFFIDQNKTISDAIIDLYRANKPIDLITLISQLKTNENLERAGGVSYISSLTSNVLGVSNLEFHIKILQEEALRRSLITIGQQTIKKSFDLSEDIFDVFSETQSKMDNALKNVINYEIKDVGTIHDEIILESYKIQDSGQKSGVPSGLKLIDKLTNGWQKTDLIILAGRPSMGKTAAAISMAIYPAVIEKRPIAIFSLEMSSQQLVSRMQSSFSEINVGKIVKKQLTHDEITRIDITSKPLKDAPIYIDDTPNISLLELKGKCRKLVKEKGVELIIIDYLQLMKSGFKTQSREQEIAEISRGLKILAKELNLPVIALAQLSRSVEMRGGDKKPMLSDLRESGQIEQDADMVAFCYRPEYYQIEQYEVDGIIFESKGLFLLIIAKNRNGELGEIPLRFLHSQTKLVNFNEDNVFSSDNSSTFVQQKDIALKSFVNQSSEELEEFNKQFSNNNEDDDELFNPF
jgi:replicative DNA helicase